MQNYKRKLMNVGSAPETHIIEAKGRRVFFCKRFGSGMVMSFVSGWT
jgi:hypothetical protein